MNQSNCMTSFNSGSADQLNPTQQNKVVGKIKFTYVEPADKMASGGDELN